MEKHSHIMQLREREVVCFPVYSPAAPQQPVLQQLGADEALGGSGAGPLPGFGWMCIWFTVLIFSAKAGIYMIKIGGFK